MLYFTVEKLLDDRLMAYSFGKQVTEAGLLNKSSCIFKAIIDMNLVTLFRAT